MVESSHKSGFFPGLSDPLRGLSARVADWFAPPSEAAADADAYKIAMEVPGVESADIDVTVQDGTITITGEKRSSREDKGETWYFSERQFGAFSRSFRLPPDADADAVAADLKDGVLTVTVPKRAQTSGNGARKVAIGRA